MTKRLSLNNHAGWRFDDPQISRVRGILNKSEVLDTLESSLEFLELLGERKIGHETPLWIVTDNAYRIHLAVEINNEESIENFASRYLKLLRGDESQVMRTGEDFEGEYRY